MGSKLWGLVLTLALAGSLLAGPGQVEAASAARHRWTPQTGGFFNDPWGNVDQQYRIERQVLPAIRHARKGSYIRIAVYSFDRTNVAKALINAHKRGVHVQVIHNDHLYTKAMKMLRHALGKNRSKKSWDYICKTGCRSVQGVMHDKFYLFEHTGGARNVVMIGSANMMRNAIVHQFNDLMVQKDAPKLYATLLKLFKQLKKDKTAKPIYWHRVISKKYQLWVLPRPRTTSKNDPIMNILRPVKCHRANGGTGINGRTKIRVSMHAWNGDRGAWIARRLRHLFAQGCNVKVLWALAGSKMKRVIGMNTPRGKVRRHADGYNTDCDPDNQVDKYSHQKYMTISGHYGSDRSTSLVVTGSSNWTHSGISGDEVILSARGKRLVRQWNRNFDHIWTKRSRPVGQSTGGFRPDPPNCPNQRHAVGRRATTRDLSFSGPYWESD